MFNMASPIGTNRLLKYVTRIVDGDVHLKDSLRLQLP